MKKHKSSYIKFTLSLSMLLTLVGCDTRANASKNIDINSNFTQKSPQLSNTIDIITILASQIHNPSSISWNTINLGTTHENFLTQSSKIVKPKKIADGFTYPPSPINGIDHFDFSTNQYEHYINDSLLASGLPNYHKVDIVKKIHELNVYPDDDIFNSFGGQFLDNRLIAFKMSFNSRKIKYEELLSKAKERFGPETGHIVLNNYYGGSQEAKVEKYNCIFWIKNGCTMAVAQSGSYLIFFMQDEITIRNLISVSIKNDAEIAQQKEKQRKFELDRIKF